MNYRLVHSGKYSLTPHEVKELKDDFSIKVNGFYALAPLTKHEWFHIQGMRKLAKLFNKKEK